MSRKHCAIIHKADCVVVQDIGSTQGTYINRERLDPGVARPLADGDELRVGKVAFRLAISGAKPAKNGSERKLSRRSKTRKRDSRKAAAIAQQVESKPVVATASGNTVRPKQAVAADRQNGVGSVDGTPMALESAPAGQAAPDEHVIDDILALIDGDESDVDNSAVNMLAGDEGTVDLESVAASEGEVEFAAPLSHESLSEEMAVPSYQLREDWDVSSVQEFVTKKQAPAVPQQKFKLKHASRAQKAAEKDRQKRIRKISGQPDRSLPRWLAWTESGIIGPIVAVLFGLALLGWVAYNVYLLYSFDG